jgi:hypothetical protein
VTAPTPPNEPDANKKPDDPGTALPNQAGGVPFATRRQHYWDGPLPQGAPALPPPEPGTGTVYLRPVHDGEWEASWQGPPGTDGYAQHTGSRQEAIDWAKSRPAAAWLTWDDTAGDYVPY